MPFSVGQTDYIAQLNAMEASIPVYTTGTFTPSVTGTTTAGTASYTVRVGEYSKVGNLVHFQISVEFTGHTGTGNLTLTGLPFASDASMIVPVLPRPGTLTYVQRLAAYVGPNSTAVTMETIGNGATANALGMVAAGAIQVAGTYIAA